MTSENCLYYALVLEQDRETIRTLVQEMARRCIRPTVVDSFEAAQQSLNQKGYSIVFVSRELILRHTQESGRSRKPVEAIRQENPELPVVLTCSSDRASDAIEAIEQGYTEFITRPMQVESLARIFDRYCPGHRAQTAAWMHSGNREGFAVIGRSAALKETLSLARKAAPTSIPVLIAGPSGTGKELIARYIHHHSRRKDGPFIRVNCAALNDSLLESELFGHEKGAFTGACRQHKGRFERAHGGTLLLDEISETSPQFQSHLLRVIEEMDLERVGGTENINVNVRIISTTNRDIHEEIARGGFREDLYYRLAGLELRVPSLQERSEDIEDLIWHFVNQYAAETGRRIEMIDPDMIRTLSEHDWPGNIRQLRNVVRTEMLLGQSPVLSLSHWKRNRTEHTRCDQNLISDELIQLAGLNLQQIEQQAILATLQQTDGNQTQAAKTLGISDRTLREKLKKYRQQKRMQAAG